MNRGKTLIIGFDSYEASENLFIDLKLVQTLLNQCLILVLLISYYSFY